MVAAGFSVNAQNVKSDVPSNTKEAFKKKYPDAQNVNWVRDGKDYKAEFRKENKEMKSFMIIPENGFILKSTK